MALTSAEIADTQRFCGYPIASVGQPSDVQSGAAALTAILTSLTSDQETTLRNVFLVNLRVLEAAIPSAGAGLDIAKAAVFERNPNELAERERLFVSWRQKLCYFLGVSFGLGVAPIYPAALVV